MTQCVVCKQEIKADDVTLNVPQGIVHAGQCQSHLAEMQMTESSSEQLNETQLLID
ncbi:protein of unknown function DUF2685 [Vibrio phage 1.081.O._10N.286.52.C2]|nr:protein of unknown function DUF2685 [Vibrio phage 1.081.O._10N.286.52.C2]